MRKKLTACVSVEPASSWDCLDRFGVTDHGAWSRKDFAHGWSNSQHSGRASAIRGYMSCCVAKDSRSIANARTESTAKRSCKCAVGSARSAQLLHREKRYCYPNSRTNDGRWTSSAIACKTAELCASSRSPMTSLEHGVALEAATSFPAEPVYWIALDRWTHEREITLSFIEPGKPASAESFNGKLRDECLRARRGLPVLGYAERELARWRRS